MHARRRLARLLSARALLRLVTRRDFSSTGSWLDNQPPSSIFYHSLHVKIFASGHEHLPKLGDKYASAPHSSYQPYIWTRTLSVFPGALRPARLNVTPPISLVGSDRSHRPHENAGLSFRAPPGSSSRPARMR